MGITHSFDLLKNTGMQILVHLLVPEGILRGLLSRVDGGIETLELRREAHSHFEWISHVEWSSLASAARCAVGEDTKK